MGHFLSSKQSIALKLIVENWLGEPLSNRTWDEYVAIAKRIPKLEACHTYVNQKLREMAKKGFAPYEICYFKAGDRSHRYEKFPTRLSMETVRQALVKSGFRDLRYA